MIKNLVKNNTTKEVTKEVIKSVLIISILRVFDMITTYIGIKKFGLVAEGNKLLQLQINLTNNLLFGILIYYVLTIILTYFVLRLIYYLNSKKQTKKPNLFKISSIVFIVVFLLVPIWNIIQITFG